MDVVWSLYAFCSRYPNTTSTVIGIVMGSVVGCWYMRRLIIKLFEKYLGVNQTVLNKVEEMAKLQEIDRGRIGVIERTLKAKA